MTTPVILVEAQPADAATGAGINVYLAGGGAKLPYTYLGQHWRAGIKQLPTIITQLNISEGDYGAGGVPQATVIEWAPARQTDLSALASYFWRDAPVTIRIGPEGAEPPVALAGKVMEAPTTDDGTMRIALADPGLKLKQPLLTARFAGTGGLEGPVEWEGKIRPRIWGRVWNVKAECIDKGNSIYCVADPLRPLAAFNDVRDKGASAAQLDVVTWQGSAAATFAALQAATAPQGGGVIAPTIACVKWWTEPAGDLCVDVQGEYSGGYVESAPQVAERIVAALAGPAFVAGTVAAMQAVRPDPVGWMVDDDATTAASVLDALLGDVSLLWLIELTGEIRLREWKWGAPVASAISHAVTRESVYRPISVAKIGYRTNQHVMARGDIAGIVLATDVTFNDGQTVEDLQPAQAGADVTGENTSANTEAVGSRTADAVNSELDQAAANDAALNSALADAQGHIDNLIGTWGSGDAIVAAAQLAADNAAQAETDAEAARDAAEAAKDDAIAQAIAAGLSETNAEASALLASTKADDADASADAAVISANAAATSKTDAEAAASAAALSEVNAGLSEGNAADSASAAAGHESTAAAHKDAAGVSASAADTAKTAAQTARSQAETFRNEASTAKDTAQGAAATATTQAGLAVTAKGQSEAAASTATNAAATATAQASSAAEERRLAASWASASGYLNRNARFAESTLIGWAERYYFVYVNDANVGHAVNHPAGQTNHSYLVSERVVLDLSKEYSVDYSFWADGAHLGGQNLWLRYRDNTGAVVAWRQFLGMVTDAGAREGTWRIRGVGSDSNTFPAGAVTAEIIFSANGVHTSGQGVTVWRLGIKETESEYQARNSASVSQGAASTATAQAAAAASSAVLSASYASSGEYLNKCARMSDAASLAASWDVFNLYHGVHADFGPAANAYDTAQSSIITKDRIFVDTSKEYTVDFRGYSGSAGQNWRWAFIECFNAAGTYIGNVIPPSGYNGVGFGQNWFQGAWKLKGTGGGTGGEHQGFVFRDGTASIRLGCRMGDGGTSFVNDKWLWLLGIKETERFNQAEANITTNANAIATATSQVASLTTELRAGLVGDNLIENALFLYNTDGVYHYTNVHGVNGSTIDGFGSLPVLNGAGTEWMMDGMNGKVNGLSIHQNGRAANDGFTEYAFVVPIKEGNWYDCSCYAAWHRTNFELILIYRDYAGTWLSIHSAGLGPGTNVHGNRYERDWHHAHVGGPKQAPTGAVDAYMIMRKYDTIAGQGDSWAWFCKPQIVQTTQYAAFPQPFRTGSNSAAVKSQSQVLADHNTKLASFLQRVSAGDGFAEIAMWALDSLGNVASRIKMVADEILLGPAKAPVLAIRDGLATFAADIYARARIVVDSDTHMFIFGLGFGTSNQFILWYGPKMAFNLCSEANASVYFNKSGVAYFGGSIIAGTLKMPIGTASTSATASATGTTGSNGGTIKVITSYTNSSTSTASYPATATGVSNWNSQVSSWGGTVDGDQALGSKSISCNISIRIDRQIGAGAVDTGWGMLNIMALTETISGTRPVNGDSAGNLNYTRSVTASVTNYDTDGGATNRTFTVTMVGRDTNWQLGTTGTQRISLVTEE